MEPSFGYVMNRVDEGRQNSRNKALVASLYDSL